MAIEYKPTIGLEVHVELKTRTKMFCDSLNNADEKEPNKNTCPVCLAHPGALPTINKEAVKYVIRTGLALGGKINPVTKFDRKNYFYPDLPKGYQISQYDQPLVQGGELLGVRVRRIHLEEDTGTLVHVEGSSTSPEHSPSTDSGQPASLVDFNRAGVPLMELVTEPDLTSAEDVAQFAKELQLILRYLGVSDANMEKGHMRIEANVSLNMGTKVELKNINSFKAVRDAIAYELKRQETALRAGERILQETRGWDESTQSTVSQRSKEEAHDYRYFPEPDLPPFETAFFDPEYMRRELPELPAAKRERFAREYSLQNAQVGILIGEPAMAEYFEESASEFRSMMPSSSIINYQLLVNYLISDARGILSESGIAFEGINVQPEHFAHLIFLISQKKVTSRQAKDMLAKMLEKDSDPEAIVKDESWYAISGSSELASVVQQVISETPQAVADFRNGKVQSLQFLIGKAMGRLKGKGNPEVLRQIFEDELSK